MDLGVRQQAPHRLSVENGEADEVKTDDPPEG